MAEDLEIYLKKIVEMVYGWPLHRKPACWSVLWFICGLIQETFKKSKNEKNLHKDFNWSQNKTNEQIITGKRNK